MKRDILYVDDEAENLIVFQATFDEYFNIVTANSGVEALELLDKHPFPVVVADQRMPRMTGAELFEAMRLKYPHTKRVMLTGYADSKAMLSAINQGQVYYFIKKPWEQDIVFSILIRAIEAYDMSVSNLLLQDRLVASDRCAMLGRSAAQLAHEMGNQLCMLPLLELIEEDYSDHEDLVRMAGFARATHERLVQIVNEVKAFVRFEREQVVTQPLALPEVIRELVEFLRFERSLPLAKLSVEIQGEPWIDGNRVKLQQVLINLLKNAAHAIRDRDAGHITLALSADAEQATIAVRDNGCGMTAEVAARIWEPFFTTKGEEGTGLGLDVAKSIIEAHGGTIQCESAPEQGSTFTICLPRCASPAEPRLGGTVSGATAPGVTAPGVTVPLENLPLEAAQHAL
jgi:signal transduction histidine kinase